MIGLIELLVNLIILIIILAIVYGILHLIFQTLEVPWSAAALKIVTILCLLIILLFVLSFFTGASGVFFRFPR